MTTLSARTAPHEWQRDCIFHSKHQVKHKRLGEKENNHYWVILHEAGRTEKDYEQNYEEHQ